MRKIGNLLNVGSFTQLLHSKPRAKANVEVAAHEPEVLLAHEKPQVATDCEHFQNRTEALGSRLAGSSAEASLPSESTAAVPGAPTSKLFGGAVIDVQADASESEGAVTSPTEDDSRPMPDSGRLLFQRPLAVAVRLAKPLVAGLNGLLARNSLSPMEGDSASGLGDTGVESANKIVEGQVLPIVTPWTIAAGAKDWRKSHPPDWRREDRLTTHSQYENGVAHTEILRNGRSEFYAEGSQGGHDVDHANFEAIWEQLGGLSLVAASPMNEVLVNSFEWICSP